MKSAAEYPEYQVNPDNIQFLSTAAKRLFIPPSSLSAALKEVEDELGIRIFNRGREFSITRDGEEFLIYARQIMDQMKKIHQFVIMCASAPSQYAGIEALRSGDNDVIKMREDYDNRRRYLLSEFNRLGLPCFEPEGAFYAFPYIGGYGLSSEEFALRLLEQEKLVVVPGTAFGGCGEGFIRISYAYSLDSLKEAMKRLERFLSKQ